MDMIVKMEALSEKYGWTPKQIREMSTEDISAYWQIMAMKVKIENQKLKKLNRK